MQDYLYEGKNINYHKNNRKPIGTGPFMFYEWKAGDHVTLLANKTYYKGVPLLSAIIYQIIPNQNPALIALRNKEVDVAVFRTYRTHVERHRGVVGPILRIKHLL